MQKSPTINLWLCSKNASVPVMKKETSYLIWFYIILYVTFILYFALKSSNRVNIIREMLIFYTLLSYVCFPFLCWIKLMVVLDRFFFIWETKKWLLVVLDRWLSYTVTTAWKFPWADSALVILDDWSSYRGGRLNRFDYTWKTSFLANFGLKKRLFSEKYFNSISVPVTLCKKIRKIPFTDLP